MTLNIDFYLNWDEYFEAQEFFRRYRYSIAPEKVIGGVLATLSALWFFFDDLNLFAIIGRPHSASAPQFKGLCKSGCGNAQAIRSLCQHHTFDDKPARVTDQQELARPRFTELRTAGTRTWWIC